MPVNGVIVSSTAGALDSQDIGIPSTRAAQFLLDHGFADWQEAGHPVERSSNSSELRGYRETYDESIFRC